MAWQACAIGSAMAIAAGSVGQAAETSRPNIIVVVIDDLGWADLGCYGSRFHETPHIDALARRGVRFTDAYAACPVCSPSRAAIMTGKAPARLRLTDWLPGRADSPAHKLLRPEIRRQLPLEEFALARAAGFRPQSGRHRDGFAAR
jgi:arylsulfatase A